jgi:hypothetical protein
MRKSRHGKDPHADMRREAAIAVKKKIKLDQWH